MRWEPHRLRFLPISGKPDIGWWSAGRRSVSVARLRTPSDRRTRAPRDGSRKPVRMGLANPFRQGCAGSPGLKHRLPTRGLANPWRLPALHSPSGRRKKGKGDAHAETNNRAAERWLRAGHSGRAQRARAGIHRHGAGRWNTDRATRSALWLWIPAPARPPPLSRGGRRAPPPFFLSFFPFFFLPPPPGPPLRGNRGVNK